MKQLDDLLLAVASLRQKYDTDNPPNKDLKVEILIEIVAQCVRAGRVPQCFEFYTRYTNQIFEVVLEIFDLLDEIDIEVGAVFNFREPNSSTILFSLVY